MSNEEHDHADDSCGCGHDHCEAGPTRYAYSPPGTWSSETDGDTSLYTLPQGWYAIFDLDDENGGVVAVAETEGMAMIITQVLNDDPEAVDAFLKAVNGE